MEVADAVPATFEDPGTPLEAEMADPTIPPPPDEADAQAEKEADKEAEKENEDASGDSSSDDDDIQITIGEIKTNSVTLGAQKSSGPIKAGESAKGKLDMEAVSEMDGVTIYDLDIAQMDEKPWRKPGADVTDYFNYGFTEESWNMYCERQRKLRAEYGPLNANRTLFAGLSTNSSTLNLASLPTNRIPTLNSNPPPLAVGGYDMFGKRVDDAAMGMGMGGMAQQPPPQMVKTVVNLARPSSNQQLSSLMGQPPPVSYSQPPPVTIIRTDLTGRSQAQIPTLGGGNPTPINVLGLDAAFPVVSAPSADSVPSSSAEGGRDADSAEADSGGRGGVDTPPPPGGDTKPVITNLAVPPPIFAHPPTHLLPPGFNAALPPPGIPGFPPRMGMMQGGHLNVPPPGFAANPPPPGVTGPPGVPGYPRPPSRPVPLMATRAVPPPQLRGPPGSADFRNYPGPPGGYGGGERSPASYSDRSSDEDRTDRNRGGGGRRDFRGGRGRSRSPQDRRRRDDYRSSSRRHRSRTPDDDRRRSRNDESRKESRKKEEEDSKDKRKKRRKRDEVKEEKNSDSDREASASSSSKKKRSKRDRSRERSED